MKAAEACLAKIVPQLEAAESLMANPRYALLHDQVTNIFVCNTEDMRKMKGELDDVVASCGKKESGIDVKACTVTVGVSKKHVAMLNGMIGQMARFS